MASPTETEIQTQIGLCIKLLSETYKYGSQNGSGLNVVAMYDALVAALETDYAGDVVAGADGLRAQISGALTYGRSMVTPLLRQYAKLLDYPETDPLAILDRLYTYFIDNSKNVQSRVFSFGSVSAGGSNSGTGTLNRLTADENAADIENVWPAAWTAECVQDEFSGARQHAEVFEIRAGDPSRDLLEILGPDGRNGSPTGIHTVRALCGTDTQRFLDNPSWDTLDGTDENTLTSIPSWTIATGVIGDYQLEGSDYYRDFATDGGTPYSLRFTDNGKITQAPRTGARFSRDVPYYFQIAFKRENSCDGTLTIRLGSQSAAVALSAQSGWTLLKITLSDDCWFSAFDQQSLDIEVELSSNTTGELLVDDLILAPMTNVGGTWVALVGGATPFLVGDTFTYTDTATEAIIQRWLWLLYDRYLPHAASTPTWTEP